MRSFLLLFFAGFAIPLFASATPPLLQAGMAVHPAANQPYMLANVYSAAATEWIVVYQTARGKAIYMHGWGLPSTPPDDIPIAPGEVRLLGGPPGAHLRDAAVIYADGTSAGDSLMIAALISARKLLLNDLQVNLNLMSQGESPYANYDDIEMQLKQQIADHRDTLKRQWVEIAGQGPPPILGADIVRGPIVNAMESMRMRGKPQMVWNEYFTREYENEVRWLHELEASKPGLR